MTKHYDIYTDGSYLNGIWGSGAIIIYDNEIIKEIKASGKDINGIRNIAETPPPLVRKIYKAT